MLKSLPNILTFLRILLIPLIFILLMLGSTVDLAWATILFVVSAITDYFDGFLARKFKSTTAVGVVFDPIADKLLVVVTLMALIGKEALETWMTIPVLLIIVREFMVSGFREVLGKYGKELPVMYLGKIKTTAELVSIFILLLSLTLSNEILYLGGVVLLVIAAVIALITAWQYWVKVKTILIEL